MKRIAITGVSGYVGSRILARLSSYGAVERVVGVDIRPPRNPSSKLVFYQQDILEPLDKIFIENGVDTAVHLAFVLKPTHRRVSAHHTDVDGARNFLESCGRSGVKHLLYLSSHTVYGAHADNPVPLTEDAPLRPLRSFQYSWDKAESEKLFRDFAASRPDVGVTILRSCPVIGPNAGDSVVTSMFTRVIVRVAGYDPVLQFVHEDDLAELITVMLEKRRGGVFNVAGGVELRYADVAGLFHRKSIALPGWVLNAGMSVSWHLRIQKESPPGGLEFIKYPPVVSTAKLEKNEGFRFRYSSREALLSYINREQPRSG